MQPKNFKEFAIMTGVIIVGVAIGIAVSVPLQTGVHKLLGTTTTPPPADNK